jgi:hypothetical protein
LATCRWKAMIVETKYFTYWWLEQNNHDRMLLDTDGL